MKRWVIFGMGMIFACFARAESTFEHGQGAQDVYPVFEDVRNIPQTKAESVREEQIEPLEHHEFDPRRKDSLLMNEGIPWMIPIHSLQEDSTSVETTASASVEAAATQSVAIKFAGIPQTDFSPPDPTIAAGPKHILIAVNRVFAIYSKDGTRLFQTTMKSWFGSLPDASSSAFFDCRVLYDQYSGHYMVLSDSFRGRDGRSWYFLSVSRNRNPLGQWAFYELDMQLNGTQKAAISADFPGIGIDPSALYLTGNMFSTLGTQPFVYGKIRIISKSQLYAFGPIQWSDFWNMIDATGVPAKNIQPAHCFGKTPVGYLANTNEAQGNQFTLWKVTNPGSSNPALSSLAVPVSSYLVPPNAVQKGGGPRISTNDSGLTSAVFRNGSLYTTQALAFDWGSGVVSAIRFYQISSAGTVVQEITYGADGKYYFFPDVMADNAGNITIVFNRCSPSEFAGIYFTGRQASDTPGTLRKAKRLHAGFANYRDPNPNGLDPWGDFNGIAKDPTNKSFWIFSEYVRNATSWATEVGSVVFQ
jgi:hypothetical protein